MRSTENCTRAFRIWLPTAAASLLLLVAHPALAVDGVLEINQTCAASSGCFPGDALGYPVLISAPGSYRLTSNLIVPSENIDGIKIDTSDVAIDLNGFAIIRSGCEGVTTDCTPVSGAGSGIERTLMTNRGISVRNGSITGMGSYGVYLGIQADVKDLRLRWNRLDAITTGSSSNVVGNVVYDNDGDGIEVGYGTNVSGNTLYNNGGAGIIAGNGSVVTENAVSYSGGDGITVEPGAVVSRNTAKFCGGDGIEAGGQSSVAENAVSGNTGYGLNLLNVNVGYRGNVVTSNTAGTVNGGTERGGSNYCDGGLAPDCP